MFYLRRVRGGSMQPTLRDRQIILFIRLKSVSVRDIVLARVGDREVVKRVSGVEATGYWLRGDNPDNSTDSRHYGIVDKSAIIASMITLPKSTNPPKLVKSYGAWLGRLLAGVLIIVALAELYRIDTFIPILQRSFEVSYTWAAVQAVLAICLAIFALPFLLRMRLSPLAHVTSGLFVVLTPLFWLGITIVLYGHGESIGELGEFVSTPATLPLLLVNAAWLVFSIFVLYALGYGTLKVRRENLHGKIAHK